MRKRTRSLRGKDEDEDKSAATALGCDGDGEWCSHGGISFGGLEHQKRKWGWGLTGR